MEFEDRKACSAWEWVDPCHRAARSTTNADDRTVVFDRIYNWYESKLTERGLTIMSMGSHGFDVFPTGCRVRTDLREGWVVPNKYIFHLCWSTLRVFLGYPPWLVRAEAAEHD